MIFYFSGTGNSKWVAQQTAQHFGEQMIAMGDYFRPNTDKKPEFTVKANEKIGFVFPIHSWGIPPLVERFMRRVRFEHYTKQEVYAIVTCGDECGYTDRMLRKIWAKRSWNGSQICAVQMPNNYIVMPGFDVDKTELAEQKKQQAELLLPQLWEAISAKTPANYYLRGSMNFLKSNIVYPLFRRYAITDKSFYSTNQCTSCGLCAKVCPVGNISLTDEGHPVWNGQCTQCLACIHRCPAHAIEYGKATQNKGRYFFKPAKKED